MTQGFNGLFHNFPKRTPIPVELEKAYCHRVVEHTVKKDLTGHPDYEAGRQGNPVAALRFMKSIMNPDVLDTMCREFGSYEPVIVYAGSRMKTNPDGSPRLNRLAPAYAVALQQDFPPQDLCNFNHPQTK